MKKALTVVVQRCNPSKGKNLHQVQQSQRSYHVATPFRSCLRHFMRIGISCQVENVNQNQVTKFSSAMYYSKLVEKENCEQIKIQSISSKQSQLLPLPMWLYTKDQRHQQFGYTDARIIATVFLSAVSFISFYSEPVATKTELSSSKLSLVPPPQDLLPVDGMGVPQSLQSEGHSNACSTATCKDSSPVVVVNWSGTHSVEVSNDRYWEPTTIEEVESIVEDCYKRGIPIRPVGSALSPNAISFHSGGMMNMSNLDEIVNVDTTNSTVTVQAGARVSQVIEELRKYKLTLPNLASIAEQQMGGFVQVGAHGTGMYISPVDHYVTAMKIVTPSDKKTITLTEENDGELFHLAKVGLGCLGIVVEITLKCIPAHKLVEHTYVLSRKDVMQQHATLLKQHKHIRYMWIPYTDSVVVVTNDPEANVSRDTLSTAISFKTELTEQEKVKPFTDLLSELDPEYSKKVMSDSSSIGFGQLRDAVLSLNPLDPPHVKRCNEAEAQFWKNNSGYQIKPSDQLLQFDCGGQQWVWEVCFPTGTQTLNNGNDMKFMEDLLNGIEQTKDGGGIPAHSPIEQRWSASSSSLMSPAHDGLMDGLHCWVGIINYLPSDETIMDPTRMEQQRKDITEYFKGPYCTLLRFISDKYNATSHWAKLEPPNSIWTLIDVQLQLQQRFPLRMFNNARLLFDPKNLLSNALVNQVFGEPRKY